MIKLSRSNNLKLKSMDFLLYKTMSLEAIQALRDQRARREDIKKTLRSHYEGYCQVLLEANSSEEGFGEELVSVFLDYLKKCNEFILELELSDDKTSTLIEIAYETFYRSFQFRMSKPKSFVMMKELLLKHSLARSPVQIHVLDLEEIKKFSDFMIGTFFRYFECYNHIFVTELQMNLSTQTYFKEMFPISLKIQAGSPFENLRGEPALSEYLPQPEIELTEEEMQEIMKGNSVHNIPLWKREELIRKRLEKERKEKIDLIMARELEKIQVKMDETIQQQDAEFIMRFDPKNKKK